jgi:hypothetical protein
MMGAQMWLFSLASGTLEQAAAEQWVRLTRETKNGLTPQPTPILKRFSAGLARYLCKANRINEIN